jgi:flagellin-like protein
MNSKAISPMIATILLIAFTVAIGGIISVWMTGYTRTTGASVSGATENMTACLGTYPDVISVTSTAILIHNPGSEEITNLTCYFGNGTNVTNISTSILSPGGIASAPCNHSATETSVICTAKCKGSGVRVECKSDQICWIS